MSNGCGCERGLFRFLKPPYAKRFYIPCVLHDNDYDKGGSKQDRKNADIRLFFRMQCLSRRMNRNPFVLTWFTLIALLYYSSIRIFGSFYFNYQR